MRNWEMKRAETETEAEQLLEEGWEPFSADINIGAGLRSEWPIIVTRYMWFKRRIIERKKAEFETAFGPED